MEAVVNSIVFFCLLIGTGAIWFVLPTLVVFPLLCRLKKGRWQSPCNLVDALTILSVCIIWVCYSGKDSTGRGLGWFVDLMAIGFIYGVLIVLRIPVVWSNLRYRMHASIVTFILTDIVMLFFAITGILGKE